MSTATTLTSRQRHKYGPEVYKDNGETMRIIADVRYDDNCGNGHNTFAITADIQRQGKNGKWYDDAGGCCHDEVAKHFPELAPLIKWHLCSSDGPMHYAANASYLAGDKDHNGRREGDPCRWEHGVRFGNSPVTHRVQPRFFEFLKDRRGSGDFQVAALQHDRDPDTYGTHYTLAGFGEKWHDCPFRDKALADEFAEGLNTCEVEFVETATDFSKGKARELDAARNAACWPEATDEELTAPGLKDRLQERLPALLGEFRAAVESMGFTW